MKAMLKKETREDLELLNSAFNKFFTMQCLLAVRHLYQAFQVHEEELIVPHPLAAKSLAVFAVVAIVLGLFGVKYRDWKLVIPAAAWLGGNTLFRIANNYLVLVESQFSFPWSMVTMLAMALGIAVSAFQFYCAALLMHFMKTNEKEKSS